MLLHAMGHGSIVECLITSGADIKAVDNVNCFLVDIFSSVHHNAA